MIKITDEQFSKLKPGQLFEILCRSSDTTMFVFGVGGKVTIGQEIVIMGDMGDPARLTAAILESINKIEDTRAKSDFIDMANRAHKILGDVLRVAMEQ